MTDNCREATIRTIVLEDDADLAALVASHLRGLRHAVDVVGNGVRGLQMALDRQYDLIILDIGLPEMDGLEVCRRYRQNDELTPILMLTARDADVDKVIGLEMGADDYLGKPFSIRELEARVKAILRRQRLMMTQSGSPGCAGLLVCDGIVIDAARRRVTCNEQEVSLTAREFDLLYFLASHPGRVYQREQLLDKIWGYMNDYYEHTVNSNINRLRNKIEQDPSRPRFIITVRGVGYKFDEAAFERQKGS